MKDLKDAVALVTGAGSGIGEATAIELAKAGCHLVLNDLRGESLTPLKKKIQAMGRRSIAVPADVSSRPQAEQMCKTAVKEFGYVDILINNAGVGMGGRMEDISIDDWEWILGINLWAHIYTVRCLLPQMLKRKKGHFVHVASANGLFSLGISLPYGVTKFAVVGLAEALAAQVRSSGIGVTVVCPGGVNTSILNRIRIPGATDKNVFAKAKKNLGNSNDVKAICNHLQDLSKDQLSLPERIMQSIFLKRIIPPEKVARQIVSHIKSDKFLLITHPELKPVIWLRTFLPQLSIRSNSQFTEWFMPREAC